MLDGNAAVEIGDALQILRQVIDLSNTASRRVCVRNRFTDGAGCQTRPTWVTFAAGIDARDKSTFVGNYYVTTCACVPPPGMVVLSPERLTLSEANNFTQSTTVSGGDGAVTYNRGNLPAWATVTVSGTTVTVTGTPPAGYTGGSYTMTVTRGDGTPVNLVVDIAAPGGDTSTTASSPTDSGGSPLSPGSDTTPPSPGGSDDSSGGTTVSTTPISTVSSTTPPPGSVTSSDTNPPIVGACRNTADPAPAANPLGACRAAAGPICGECGYCAPCDWWWFGVNTCGECHIGADCAARLGINFCAVCLNCAAHCSCGAAGPHRHGPTQATGSCTYCQQGGRPVCASCSECFHCLYERPAWDNAQDPWGIVICAACGNCSNCKSVTNAGLC
jgi:hypothetical protein